MLSSTYFFVAACASALGAATLSVTPAVARSMAVFRCAASTAFAVMCSLSTALSASLVPSTASAPSLAVVTAPEPSFAATTPPSFSCSAPLEISMPTSSTKVVVTCAHVCGEAVASIITSFTTAVVAAATIVSEDSTEPSLCLMSTELVSSPAVLTTTVISSLSSAFVGSRSWRSALSAPLVTWYLS